MKKIILSVAVLALVLNSSAQKENSDEAKKLKFSVGAEAALPLGDFGKISTFGIGGSAQVDYNIASDIDLTFNAGYISFSGKSETIAGLGTFKYPTQSFIPVLAGAKYHFTESVFGSAQLGVTFLSVSGGGGSETAFAYAPGIGYKFSENLDALVKYTGYSANGSSISAIGLRVAYTF